MKDWLSESIQFWGFGTWDGLSIAIARSISDHSLSFCSWFVVGAGIVDVILSVRDFVVKKSCFQFALKVESRIRNLDSRFVYSQLSLP